MTIYKKILNRLKGETKTKIKACFIGQGNHARACLYPSLPHAGIELLATCALHNADYTDYVKMLKEVKMDAVICCVDALIHPRVAETAIGMGIPVFIEKPPAENSKIAKDIWKWSDQRKVFVMVGFNKRFSPIYQQAKRLSNKATSVTMSINVGKTDELWTQIGIHYIDLMRFFMGEIKSISSSNVGANYIVSFQFESGAIGSLQISPNYNWYNTSEHIELMGAGLVTIDNGHTLTYHREDKTLIWQPNYPIPFKENHLIYTNGYVGELSYFADVVSHKGMGASSIEDGFKALAIMEQF
jgi:virulence factor